jgi:CDP-diacylglycerol--serine O-phosphatidyltransferase
VVDGRYFVGQPIPAAAGQIAAVVHFIPEPRADRVDATLALVVVIVLSFLMVSTLRYHSFKSLDLRARRSYIDVLGIALFFLLIFLHPEISLLAMATAYTLSGPAGRLAGMFRRRGSAPAVATDEASRP